MQRDAEVMQLDGTAEQKRRRWTRSSACACCLDRPFSSTASKGGTSTCPTERSFMGCKDAYASGVVPSERSLLVTPPDTSERPSFEAVVAAYYPALVKRLALIVRDPQEAQDLAQARFGARRAGVRNGDGRRLR